MSPCSFSDGLCLAPAVGTTTTIKGYFMAPMSKIFCSDVSSAGSIRLASVNSSDAEGGLQPRLPRVVGSCCGRRKRGDEHSSDSGGYHRSLWDHPGLTQRLTRSTTAYLHFWSLYNINAEIHVYHMIGFRWEGENQFGSGLRQLTCGARIIDGQSIAYGQFENLRFENDCGGKSAAALVDIDYDGTKGADLRPQNITFYDDFFAGNSLTDVGVLIAKSGGGAQGDNIRCYNCDSNGFTGAWLGRSAAIIRAGTPGAATPRMQSKSRLSAEIFKDVHSTAWLPTAAASR